MKVPQTFSEKKNGFHTGLESSEKAFTTVWYLHQGHTAVWTTITQTDFSWCSHNLKYFLATQGGEMPTRYHGSASARSAYEMRLAGKSNINSLRANHSSPITSDSLSQADKGTYKRGGNAFTFPDVQQWFFPFLFQFLFPQSREINMYFIKAPS